MVSRCEPESSLSDHGWNHRRDPRQSFPFFTGLDDLEVAIIGKCMEPAVDLCHAGLGCGLGDLSREHGGLCQKGCEVMLSVLQAEWYKLRKSKMIFIIAVGPLISFFIGWLNDTETTVTNEWVQPFFWMNFSYALLFLPLVTGVLAGMICRYEHQAGGWKQLLSLPVTRGTVFVAKFSLILIIVWIIQLLFIVSVWLVGIIKGFVDPFPRALMGKTLFGGWISTFPLIALQLWLSMRWKSFAVPFAVNGFFTLPSILAANSERFGPYYPWSQPFLMMLVGEERESVFYVPWEQLLMVVGGSFLFFFVLGYLDFQRKAV